MFSRATHTDKKRISGGLSSNASNTRNVLHSLVEKHEVHLGDSLVVLFKLDFEDLFQFVIILNGLVGRFVTFALCNERSVNEGLLKHSLFLVINKLLQTVSHVVVIEVDIFFEEETVEPDSVTLVSPHAHNTSRISLV